MFVSALKTRVPAPLVALTLALALPFGGTAFAQSSATLTDSERAAQRAIVDPPSPRREKAVSVDAIPARLLDNELAARRILVDPPRASDFAATRRNAANDVATLAHNELAAREAIAGTQGGASVRRDVHAIDAGSAGSDIAVRGN